MTERVTRPVPYGGYIGEPKPAGSVPASPGSTELSPKKTLFVLVVVVGCFAILWPKLFYPMLVANANNQMKPNSFDKGCCDVIDLKDVETIRIMSELCKDISTQQGSLPDSQEAKKMVENCRKSVLETCGIDISAALRERVHLGHSVKQILDEVRSLNGSLCLKYHFGLSPSRLGVPHIRVTVNPTNKIRQERPPHLRPEIMHPAFRERGKAIPHPELSVTKRPSSQPLPRIVEGRPGPIPGLRPGLGGPGHVIQKQQSNGIMGFLMPIYTIGFVIFFTYTLMKIAFKKKPEMLGEDFVYPEVDPDENFRREVFESTKNYNIQQQRMNGKSQKDSKIVVNAVAALLEEVDQEIQTRTTASYDLSKETLNEQDEVRPNGQAIKEEYLEKTGKNIHQNEDAEEEEDQPRVAVMGMETTVSSEHGKKWSRPDSPTLPHPRPVEIMDAGPPPQEIYLEATLPPDSQILVAESATETETTEEDDSAVVLAGKMTLSVISLDSENDTNKSSDEERKSSSGNTSEDFEKIDSTQLEEHINDIIEETQKVLVAENDEEFDLNEKTDNINDKVVENLEKTDEVLEELKQQFQLEDKLLKTLTPQKSKPEDLPVTDIIKEFLLSEDEDLILKFNEPVFQKIESGVQFTHVDDKTEPNLGEKENKSNLNQVEALDVQPTELQVDRKEMNSIAEQLLNDIEDELQNVNVEDIIEDIEATVNKKIISETDQTPIEDSSKSEQVLRKSEERFIPHQNSSEDRKKRRQNRLKRDLEALTSSVEEAMGTKVATQSFTESFEISEDGDENKTDLDELPLDLDKEMEANVESRSLGISNEKKIILSERQEDMELSQEDLEVLERYQTTNTEDKLDQKKDNDQGSEKSFDSTDTVKEGGATRDNEYLFGSKEQKSLLAALEMSTSGQNNVNLEDEGFKGLQKERYANPIEKVIEYIEYDSEEEDLQDEEDKMDEDDQEDLEYKNDENDDDSDIEDEERSLGRSSLRDDGGLNGDLSEKKVDVANGSETNAEDEISDDDEIENEEDEEESEEIEEIIEYVDNTDEEGEEIIEIEDDEIRNGHH